MCIYLIVSHLLWQWMSKIGRKSDSTVLAGWMMGYNYWTINEKYALENQWNLTICQYWDWATYSEFKILDIQSSNIGKSVELKHNWISIIVKIVQMKYAEYVTVL